MMTYKMLFVVNGTLSMSSGKMAAQVAHCAVDLYQAILDRRMQGLNFWKITGQRKIVVRGDSAEELLDIQQRIAVNRTVVTTVIQDAGLTEIASGSITCLGLFGTDNQLDPFTRHLKLMNDCLKCSNSNMQPKSRKNRKDAESKVEADDGDDVSNTQ